MINLLTLFIFNNYPTILSVVTIVSLGLYLREYYRSRELVGKIESASLEKVQEKSFGLLHKAIRKAQSILGNAEMAGIKIAADSKFTSRKLEEKYQLELDQFVKTAQNQYLQFLNNLQLQSEQAQNESIKATTAKAHEMFSHFEQNLADFLTQTEQKSLASIELELKAARQLIDTYKHEQLTLIDENIVAMLEKTLSLVLAKKLSLADQMDLIYEALEKAKVEKFIV